MVCKHCSIDLDSVRSVKSKLLCHKCYMIEYHKKNKDKITAYNKQYYVDNKEKEIRRVRIYQKNNPDKKKEANKKYYKKHREEFIRKSNLRDKIRRKTDNNFRIKEMIRGNIYKCVTSRTSHSSKKYKRTEEILGCSIEYFKNYIASKFIDNMSWDNYGEWHLDHIKPISLAKTEEEVYKLCHYTNYQPLWAKDNLTKGCKYIEGDDDRCSID